MPFSWSYDDDPTLLRLVLTGSWSAPAEHAAIKRALGAAGVLGRAIPTLIDLRASSDATLPGEFDGWTMTDDPNASKVPIRRAFLVGSDLQFVVSRMFQTLAASPNRQIEIFRDAAAAIKWLRGKSE